MSKPPDRVDELERRVYRLAVILNNTVVEVEDLLKGDTTMIAFRDEVRKIKVALSSELQGWQTSR